MMPEFQLVDLTTIGQTFWESEALVDWTSDRLGIVILDVSLPRFLVSGKRLRELAAHQRLGFRSRAFDREIEIAGLPTHSMYDRYFLDNESFFIDRWPNAFLNSCFGHTSEPAKDAECTTRLSANAESIFNKSFDTHAKALRRIIEIVTRKSRFDVILLAIDPPGSRIEQVERRNALLSQAATSTRIQTILAKCPFSDNTDERLWECIRERLARSDD